MVESLKELNQICQKPNYKTVGNWMARHIVRDVSLPITWLLLHTSLTANQATLTSLVVACLGITCFAFQGSGFFLLGSVLLQLWYVLDHVDGQIARYRKTASLSGRFFDFITHHIVHGALFFPLSLYCFFVTGQFGFVLWGFITTFSMTMFNLIHDVKYKTFFERLSVKSATQVKGYSQSSVTPAVSSHLKKLFSIAHKLCEMHIVMNILTLFSILQMFRPNGFDFRLLTFFIYGFLIPLIAVIKIVYLVLNKKIDQEYYSIFPQ